MNIDFSLLKEKLIEAGMNPGRAASLCKKAHTAYESIPFDTQAARAALAHGFLPDKVEPFGLCEENYAQYLSDFDYHMMHPLNNHFCIWVNDKLTLKYMLNTGELAQLMPEYYIYIENDGHYTYLMDMPSDIERDGQSLLSLLRQKRILAMKPNHGEGGAGFVRLELVEDGTILANSKPVPEEEFPQFAAQLDGYIVTEYIRQHRDFSEVWPNSECSLRVIMAKRPQNDPYAAAQFDCIVSYARFGGSSTGSVSNISQGGVAVPFDYETGEFWNHGWMEMSSGQADWNVLAHPDTGVAFEGRSVPRYDEVRDCLKSVCEYLSSLDYFGFDIMVSDDAAKVCEINTLPGFDFEQVMWGPILAKEPAKSFYAWKRRPTKEGLFLEIVDECTL